MGKHFPSLAARALHALMPLLLLLCTASAQEPQIRASFGTQDTLWTGERLPLVVDLLAPGYFSGVPSFDLPDLSGLLLLPAEGSPLLSTENINGVSYTVQRHELSVFARQAGAQTIAPFSVHFRFKRNPLDKDAVLASLKTPQLPFTVKLPPGAEKLGSIISARHLEAREIWHPEPGKATAKPGAAFTRTITFTAPDVPAMVFPPFPVPDVDGLGIYHKAPEILDHDDRGQFTGLRRETITYVCQRPGSFVIPPTRLTWFDLDAKQLSTVSFPQRVLEVEGSIPAMEDASGAVFARHSAKAWLILPAVVSGLLLWWKNRSFFRPVPLAPLNPPAL